MAIDNKEMKFSIEIDSFNREAWENCACEFADYSIYQTWPYQECRSQQDKQDVIRAIVREKCGNVCMMAQVRVKTIPLINSRIGYVQWGPLVRKHDGMICDDPEAFRLFADALMDHGLTVLRAVPAVMQNVENQSVVKGLNSVSYSLAHDAPYRTFIVDVSDSEEGIRKRLHKSFRRDLKYAEKRDIEIRSGYDQQLFGILSDMYAESKKRKGFQGLEIEEFAIPQCILSESEKMKVFVALQNDQPVSTLLSTELGDSAIVLLAASNEMGLQLGSSYLLWYQACISAHGKGLTWCDLGGIDPDENPNVYKFKSRLGGCDSSHIGVFDSCKNIMHRIIWRVICRMHGRVKK